MLKATWMMKFLKSRRVEVIQTSKVVWRKQGFNLVGALVLYRIIFFLERATVGSWMDSNFGILY